MALLTFGIAIAGISYTAYDYVTTRDKYIKKGDNPEVAHQKALEHITPGIISIVVPVGNYLKATNIFIKYSPQLGKQAINLVAKAIIDYTNENTDDIKIENINVETETDDIDKLKDIAESFVSPDNTSKTTIQTPTETYEIQEGDTVWDIAQEYRMSVDEVIALNLYDETSNPDGILTLDEISDDRSFILIKPGKQLLVTPDWLTYLKEALKNELKKLENNFGNIINQLPEGDFENLKNSVSNTMNDLKNSINTNGFQDSLKKTDSDVKKASKDLSDTLRLANNNIKNAAQSMEGSKELLDQSMDCFAEAKYLLEESRMSVSAKIVEAESQNSANLTGEGSVYDYNNISTQQKLLEFINNPLKAQGAGALVYSPVIDGGNSSPELFDALQKSTLEFLSLVSEKQR